MGKLNQVIASMQGKKTQAENVIREIRPMLVDWYDLAATQDWANTEANADVIVDEDTVVWGRLRPMRLFTSPRSFNLLCIKLAVSCRGPDPVL